jgi:hypothetical protein
VSTHIRSAKQDAFNTSEAALLLSSCRDLLDHLIIRLPLFAGLRIDEVQHLRHTWLLWDKETIELPSKQVCECYECRTWRKGIWTPKTGAGIRSLLIVPEIEPYLKTARRSGQ